MTDEIIEIIAIAIPILVIVGILLVLFIISLRAKLRTTTTALAESEISNKELKEREELLAKELELKKIENLRFALNPHSFRNTLNTIEYFAKSTYDSVHSLSGIFDYMLYDAKSQYVPLEQEINFAKRYLNLYKLRLNPTVSVKFDIDPIIEKEWANTKLIAPLIFAHFIENAFKHGDLNSDDAFITVKLEPINDNELIYSVRNKIRSTPIKQKGGMGNDQFLERLELLYKNRHELDYYPKSGTFSANLKLNLYHE